MTNKMPKRIINFHAIIFVLLTVPVAIATGQDKKTEQRIKIVFAGDDGRNVVLDTLITGSQRCDSIILKDGNTLYLAELPSDSMAAGKGMKYIVTTTSTGQKEGKKEITRKITVISSDSDKEDISVDGKCGNMTWVPAVSGNKYTFTENENKDTESTKYVISRDGISVTVEGSDYAKVKEIVNKIENTLDNNAGTGQK
jgi:hypothetical protein